MSQLSENEKWTDSFGSQQTEIMAFLAPFVPLWLTSIHIGYLVFLPLGLFFSYAVIDLNERLRCVIVNSETLQKRLVWCTVINLFSTVSFPLIGAFVTIASAFYCHFLAKREYKKLTNRQAS